MCFLPQDAVRKQIFLRIAGDLSRRAQRSVPAMTMHTGTLRSA